MFVGNASVLHVLAKKEPRHEKATQNEKEIYSRPPTSIPCFQRGTNDPVCRAILQVQVPAQDENDRDSSEAI
jgi:hypothetical protein